MDGRGEEELDLVMVYGFAMEYSWSIAGHGGLRFDSIGCLVRRMGRVMIPIGQGTPEASLNI